MTLKVLIPIVLSVSTAAASAVYVIEDRYSTKKEVRRVEVELASVDRRLEEKIILDEYVLTQQRIWEYEDRIRDNPDDESATQTLRDLRIRKNILERDLNKLRNSTSQ